MKLTTRLNIFSNQPTTNTASQLFKYLVSQALSLLARLADKGKGGSLSSWLCGNLLPRPSSGSFKF